MSFLFDMKFSKLILVLSLALNLVVGGVVIGAWLGGSQGEHNGHPRWIAGPYGRALSDEDRREMRERFKLGAGAEMREQRKAMRAAGLEVVQALRAEPFDPSVVEAIMEHQGKLGTAQYAIGSRVLLEQISLMTPELRAAFAARLEQAFERRRHAPRD
ncbi:MAG: periplasmic heavy metal sensor [Litoreibacter sp.]